MIYTQLYINYIYNTGAHLRHFFMGIAKKFYNLSVYLKLYTPPKIPLVIKADPEKEYILTRKTAFQNLKTTNNTHIDSIFYDKQLYNEVMREKNKFETEWKTRILFEYTPRGNVIMFYDPYKMGFSYYSDQSIISYDLLNSCAMRYVTIFQCYHFFMDEFITTESSPLIEIHHPIQKAQQVKTTKTNKPAANLPFAKLRNYARTEDKTCAEPVIEKMKNKFVYLGRMNNIKFLQAAPKRNKVLAKFTSPLLEYIIQDSDVQLETMKYSDYKKLKTTLSNMI